MSTDLVPLPDDGLEPLKGHHTPEVILAGLTALALNGGDSKTAHQLLKHAYPDADLPAERTLREWRTNQYPNRYQHILATRAPEIEASVEHQLRESVRLTGLAKHKILNRLNDNVEQIDPKDLGKTAQQLAVAEGVGLDKLLVLTGRPNQITETRDASDLLAELANHLPPTSIPGTAQDISQDTNTEERHPAPLSAEGRSANAGD